MAVEVKLYIRNDSIAGIMVLKNGRGFLFSLSEFEKILVEGKELLELIEQNQHLAREVKQLA